MGALTRDWLKAHHNDTPEFARFVDTRLGQEYVVVLHNPYYTIYARRERAASVNHECSGHGACVACKSILETAS